MKNKYNIGDEVWVICERALPPELESKFYVCDWDFRIRGIKNTGKTFFYTDLGIHTEDEDTDNRDCYQYEESDCFSTLVEAQAECDRRNNND